MPEAISFVLKTITLMAPTPLAKIPGYFSYSDSDAFRITESANWKPRELTFSDMFAPSADTPLAVLDNLMALLVRFYDLWDGKTACIEIFEPSVAILAHLSSKECASILGTEMKVCCSAVCCEPALTPLQKKIRATSKEISTRLSKAKLLRRPLELHHHRPLAIASNLPKFEEDYNMDKHYDPNDDRREMAKLKAEHKREKKGAVREIRKDARFISRVKLQEDKTASKEYHAKMARLTAMIQSEEGAAANEYKRERARKK